MAEFTAGSKTSAAAATGLLLAGFAVIARSTVNDQVAGSIGGACLVMAGLSLMILVCVRRWIVNTSEERRALAVTQQQAQDQWVKYIAAQAAMESEHGRLIRDVAAERARLNVILHEERKKMAAEFAEERAQLAAEAFRTGVEMERSGALRKHNKAPEQTANLIEFPKQGLHQEPQHERARERGVVGP